MCSEAQNTLHGMIWTLHRQVPVLPPTISWNWHSLVTTAPLIFKRHVTEWKGSSPSLLHLQTPNQMCVCVVLWVSPVHGVGWYRMDQHSCCVSVMLVVDWLTCAPTWSRRCSVKALYSVCFVSLTLNIEENKFPFFSACRDLMTWLVICKY